MSPWCLQAVLGPWGSHKYTIWHHEPNFPYFVYCSYAPCPIKIGFVLSRPSGFTLSPFFLRRNTKSGSTNVTWNNGCGITPEIFLDYQYRHLTDRMGTGGSVGLSWFLLSPQRSRRGSSQWVLRLFSSHWIYTILHPVCLSAVLRSFPPPFPCPYHNLAFGFIHHLFV